MVILCDPLVANMVIFIIRFINIGLVGWWGGVALVGFNLVAGRVLQDEEIFLS